MCVGFLLAAEQNSEVSQIKSENWENDLGSCVFDPQKHGPTYLWSQEFLVVSFWKIAERQMG